MFKQQEVLIESMPVLRTTLARYQWKAATENWLDLLEAEAHGFIVTLPFIGAFSAGKSSLLNALLGERLLSTNIDPETTFPAELSYGVSERLMGNLADGKTVPLSRDDLHDNLAGKLPKGSYVSATLNNPVLSRLPHLRLVDMPGWDSGIEAHNSAIDSYVARSLAYCVVVSAEEGSLRETLRRALRELAVRQMPILAIISKSDKRPPEDVDAVAKQVAQEIEAVTGHPPFAVIRFTNRQKQPAELISALEQLEQNSEVLFKKNVIENALGNLAGFNQHLDTLINGDDLDSEKIRSQCDQLNAEMKDFQARLIDETKQLESRVEPVLNRVMERVKNSLHDELDSLARECANGGDPSGSIGSAVRLAVEEGMAADFTPEIKRYLSRVEAALPPNFMPEVSLDALNHRASGDGDDAAAVPVMTPMLAMAAQALKFAPHPVAKAVGVAITALLPVIGLLESMFASKAKQEADEARKFEEIKSKLRGSFPSTLNHVRAAVKPVLDAQIALARQAIADSTQAQLDSRLAALAELSRKLTEGQAAFARAKVQYEADKATVANLVNGLVAV